MENNITQEEFNNKYQEFMKQEFNIDTVATKNEILINSKMFKKTHQAKYLIKNADKYETVAQNILFNYFSQYPFDAAFDKDDKKLYIINLICPQNIPSFSLVGIKSLQDFSNLVVAAGKKILVEEDLDRVLSDEEFESKMKVSMEVAERYNKEN